MISEENQNLVDWMDYVLIHLCVAQMVIALHLSDKALWFMAITTVNGLLIVSDWIFLFDLMTDHIEFWCDFHFHS